jgi:hypothetical protein
MRTQRQQGSLWMVLAAVIGVLSASVRRGRESCETGSVGPRTGDQSILRPSWSGRWRSEGRRLAASMPPGMSGGQQERREQTASIGCRSSRPMGDQSDQQRTGERGPSSSAGPSRAKDAWAW